MRTKVYQKKSELEKALPNIHPISLEHAILQSKAKAIVLSHECNCWLSDFPSQHLTKEQHLSLSRGQI
jgi:hypothetical protein